MQQLERESAAHTLSEHQIYLLFYLPFLSGGDTKTVIDRSCYIEPKINFVFISQQQKQIRVSLDEGYTKHVFREVK